MGVGNVVSNIGLLASQNTFLAYFIVYLVTIFLGNLSAFAGLWLVFRGYFGIAGVPLMVGTIFLSDLSADVLWYSLGRATRGTRFGNWVKGHLPWHDKIERTIHRNGRGWLFVSKFVYGSTVPIGFSIGWATMEFKKFFRNSVFSILAWLPILLLLGYGLVSGLSPLRALAVFHNFEWVFLIGLVLFIILDYLIAKLFSWMFARKGHREV